MSDTTKRLAMIAHWIQQEDEEIEYEPDGEARPLLTPEMVTRALQELGPRLLDGTLSPDWECGVDLAQPGTDMTILVHRER